MTERLRSVAELVSTPWRNGGGVTRFVATDSADDEPGWRISIATVSDGAEFSSFAGYDRTFIPLDTGRITLSDEGGPLHAGAGGVVTFDGATAVHARVTGGEALALNIMTRTGHQARIRQHTATGLVPNSYPHLRACIVMDGAVTDATGRTVSAPAVMTPGYPVTTEHAHLLDIFINPAHSFPDRTPP